MTTSALPSPPATGTQNAVQAAHSSNANGLPASAGGKILLSGGRGNVNAWNPATGRCRATYLGSPRESVWSVAADSPRRAYAATLAKKCAATLGTLANTTPPWTAIGC